MADEVSHHHVVHDQGDGIGFLFGIILLLILLFLLLYYGVPYLQGAINR